MGILIAHPENKEKSDALKAFMKALKIQFEEEKSAYDPEFVKKIKRSKEDFEAGRYKAIKTDDLWK
ncbi:hypothetical protein SAMN05192574_102618 [Mucilaginibacter gossypiicola]|uniref:Uncharacterized protein n=1 Tax=Mucilaginibacter gossypiicola TaxID=551995 RepID=A0A1H8E8G0_9SPHI|nr:DUF2683 family protein [Mucilaginibacter gossypiicola]SEN15690.1 hypothetical protein SAMN05192574_102618 [Mucilaginibacter gossypiicola]